MEIQKVLYGVAVLVLRVALVTLLLGAGWTVYRALPETSSGTGAASADATTVQILIRRDQKTAGSTEGLPFEVHPIDIVAVRNEFYAERRPGERYDDFRKQRMKGRAPITGRFDAQGQATVEIAPGDWWVYATLSGEEELEWRLRVSVSGRRQLVELTPYNAYLRSKSF